MLSEFMVYPASCSVLSMQIPLFPRDPTVRLRRTGKLTFSPAPTQMCKVLKCYNNSTADFIYRYLPFIKLIAHIFTYHPFYTWPKDSIKYLGIQTP